MYNGSELQSDSRSDISYVRKKNKRYNESGRIKFSQNSKNKSTKNYHFLQKAYGFNSTPYKNPVASSTHRETMLTQNKGHLNYVVCFPDDVSSQ